MASDADEPDPILDSEAEAPPSRRRGIALCLSGGGFRATLFHLGAIQRLFELGIATRPDFDTVTSVSGGSITAALPSSAWDGPARDIDGFAAPGGNAISLRRVMPGSNASRGIAMVAAGGAVAQPPTANDSNNNRRGAMLRTASPR
jgi:NTE family protein